MSLLARPLSPLVLGAALVLAAIGTETVSTQDTPLEPKKPAEIDLSSGPRAVVKSIANAIRSGDHALARRLADGYRAKNPDGLDEVMSVFKPPKIDGLRWEAPKPTDYIEVLIRDTARDGPRVGELIYYEQIAPTIDAVGLVAQAYTPSKEMDGKTRKGWVQANQQLLDGARALAKAAKAKNAADVKAAAIQINTACNACHVEHRN